MKNATSLFQRDITSKLIIKDIWELGKVRNNTNSGIICFSWTRLPEESLRREYRKGMIDRGWRPIINRHVFNLFRDSRHYNWRNWNKKVREFRTIQPRCLPTKGIHFSMDLLPILDTLPIVINPRFMLDKKQRQNVHLGGRSMKKNFPKKKPRLVNYPEPNVSIRSSLISKQRYQSLTSDTKTKVREWQKKLKNMLQRFFWR